MSNSFTKDETVTHLKDAASILNDDLHKAANRAGRSVRSMYDSASDEISHASEYVGTEIRSNPVRSSVIALGVGVLLGALLRR
jgi:ElaB/YqjD/DUF883 family membrane-anchored ribosome-binding protein